VKATRDIEDQPRVLNEDSMLLAEMVHRTANEATSALAALHLVKAAKGSQARRRLIDRATARIEGFAEINRALAVSFGRPVDVGLLVDRMVTSMMSGRGSCDGRVVLSLESVYVEPAQARRVLLLTYELVSNAMRHVIDVRGGLLAVALYPEADCLVVRISDDGPGLAGTADSSGTGLGSKLVADLVHRAGGRLECLTGADGTTFRVRVPVSAPSDAVIVHQR
jgi:two-component sensor histidine kinase